MSRPPQNITSKGHQIHSPSFRFVVFVSFCILIILFNLLFHKQQIYVASRFEYISIYRKLNNIWCKMRIWFFQQQTHISNSMFSDYPRFGHGHQDFEIFNHLFQTTGTNIQVLCVIECTIEALQLQKSCVKIQDFKIHSIRVE